MESWHRILVDFLAQMRKEEFELTNTRQDLLTESEIISESIKPKGYPTPRYTYGPAALPLTSQDDGKG